MEATVNDPLEGCRDADGKLDLGKVTAREYELVNLAARYADELVVLRNHLVHCQVCARADVTPERIVELTNHLNPAGTENGWSIDEGTAAVVCADDANRMHWILIC